MVRSVPTQTPLDGTYADQRVLVTGHTGFKGGWLTAWLERLGARVTGYALPAPTEPSLFEAAAIGNACRHVVGDVQDLELLTSVVDEGDFDFVFHLAAQPIVRRSYQEPIETLSTNVLGTANVLEAVRRRGSPCTVVVITTDKCYENREWTYGYRETDRLGGHDIYSGSKAAAELVTRSYRDSFFPTARIAEHGVAVATARAGNVIGGGDWATDRIVPDIVRALADERDAEIRNPQSTRPWQHVLEPLAGYLLLGARMSARENGSAERYCTAWNFGPDPSGVASVRDLADLVVASWGSGTWVHTPESSPAHEAGRLMLSIEKARDLLGWAPRWDLADTVRHSIDWYKTYYGGASPEELRGVMDAQIDAYLDGQG